MSRPPELVANDRNMPHAPADETSAQKRARLAREEREEIPSLGESAAAREAQWGREDGIRRALYAEDDHEAAARYEMEDRGQRYRPERDGAQGPGLEDYGRRIRVLEQRPNQVDYELRIGTLEQGIADLQLSIERLAGVTVQIMRAMEERLEQGHAAEAERNDVERCSKGDYLGWIDAL